MKLPSLAAAVALALFATSAPAARLKVGQPVPNSDLRGQVVVLNYWATWCVPCRTELPLLNGYYLVAAKRGWPLKIFAVATEDSIPKYQLKHLFDALSISPTDRIKGGPFGDVDALPTNYVIDKFGVLRYAEPGAFDLDDLNTILVPLMNERTPAAEQSGGGN
jgi:cytochrome c biogenesis protein CcmG/thiol:disulfide interchange protein DsbE